jgi:hypothetical protein
MYLPSMSEEMAGLNLGDKRRSDRALAVVTALQAHPDASYPDAFGDDAALEAFYRLLGNEAVTPAAIVSPHSAATVRRAAASACVLVIHDSTDVVHGSGKAREDFYEIGGHFGYVAHVGLCVDWPSRVPLGVVHLECVEREELRNKEGAPKRQGSHREVWGDANKESLRWVRGVQAAGRLVGANAIHVTDREGDSYELLARFLPHRFVVRGAYNRRVFDEEGKPSLLLEVGERAELVFCRKPSLSARQNVGRREKKQPSRDARAARLGVSAARVQLRRPAGLPAQSADGTPLPKELEVNVVFVREVDTPEGEDPIEWTLFTTEPIDTPEAIATVVDIYRTRWMIEEFFKALKTGCAFSTRQLESLKTSQTALALTLPIAWRLLLIRALDRNHPDAPASAVLSPLEIVVLAALTRRKPAQLRSVGDVAAALAKLGGHLKSNGAPGWQVLGRGWLKLTSATAVAIALKEAAMD